MNIRKPASFCHLIVYSKPAWSDSIYIQWWDSDKYCNFTYEDLESGELWRLRSLRTSNSPPSFQDLMTTVLHAVMQRMLCLLLLAIHRACKIPKLIQIWHTNTMVKEQVVVVGSTQEAEIQHDHAKNLKDETSSGGYNRLVSTSSIAAALVFLCAF